MIKSIQYPVLFSAILILIFTLGSLKLDACSTFKLKHGNKLIYGHNLNQGDIGVPGLIFINKRGVFKTGRTLSELTTLNKLDPSSHVWISRFGSVTFNNFGRDFPDGGMNEAGLYIWEMNEDADYPKNDSLPKLNQMNWMQFILDNFSTIEEAIQCATEIQIDGWGWHYFVGDNQGNTAAIAFIDGQVVVDQGEYMPIPALFNSPYKRELELLKYYRGYGGLYEPDLNDPEVPRFAKAAKMIEDYNPIQDIVEYGFDMLKHLQVNDVPEWSVICDVKERNIFFRTRINQEIKNLSMDEIDFSNRNTAQVLNMDIKKAGDVLSQFQPYTNEIMSVFIESLIFPIAPEEFFTSGGISLDEYKLRFSTHSDAAALDNNQFFKGVWKTKPDESPMEITIKLDSDKEAIFGKISIGKDYYDNNHIKMIGNNLSFTFRTHDKMLIEIQATIDNQKMNIAMYGIEDNYGSFILFKEYD